MSRPRVVCQCGKDISANLLLAHVKTPKCSADTEYKNLVKEYSILASIFRYGWNKKDGLEGQQFSWYARVLRGEININDVGFERPRPLNINRPSTSMRHSIERIGTGNPSSHPSKYGFEIIKNAICKKYDEIISNPELWAGGLIPLIGEYMDVNFETWTVGLLKKDSKGRLRGFRGIISSIIREYDQNAGKNIAKVRGALISRGQKNSPDCLKKADESGIRNGNFRTSKTQVRLLNLFHEYDPSATLEKVLKWKCFDIYSPKYNALIEMHGRVWHDLVNGPVGLRDKVTRNIENDKYKALIAKDNDFPLWIFWDDHENSWREQIEKKIKEIEIVKTY